MLKQKSRLKQSNSSTFGCFFITKFKGVDVSDSQQFVDASAAIATSKAATYAGSGAAGVSAWMISIATFYSLITPLPDINQHSLHKV